MAKNELTYYEIVSNFCVFFVNYVGEALKPIERSIMLLHIANIRVSGPKGDRGVNDALS